MTLEPATSKKLVSNVHKELDSSLDIEVLRGVDSVVLVVIPQVQLSPYVHALLLQEGLLLSRRIILIHPRTDELSKRLFSKYSNVQQLDIKRAHSIQDVFLEELIARLATASCRISALVLHNFAGSINQSFVESLAGAHRIANIADAVKVYVYADGSRNNATPEMSDQISSGFHAVLQDRNYNSSLYHFGFVHNTSSSSDSSIKLVSYDFIQASYKLVGRCSNFDNSSVEKRSRLSLVLSRYWGRKPYIFSESVDLAELFSSSISSVVSNELPLIYRDDNRAEISAKNVKEKMVPDGYEVLQFDQVFDVFYGNHRTLLFENFIMDNPDFLSRVSTIYCFDSSFPLIFQDRLLYEYLPRDLKLYVGFDRSAVLEYGIDECYSIMKQRTVETILSVCRCKNFNVFDNDGLFFSPSWDTAITNEDINSRFNLGTGYFYMMKL